MSRKASYHLMYRRPNSPLWSKPVGDIGVILGVPMPTIRAAYYGGPVGIGLVAAAALRGFDILENFVPTTRDASPLTEAEERRAEIARTRTAVSILPMRLSDIPNPPVPDLLGRRDINDAVGSFSGVWGVMTEHGYAVTRMPLDGSFRVSADEDTGGDSMCDGLAIPANASEEAYSVLERRFPGLKVTPEMREKRIILSDPSYLKAFNRDYAQTVEWAD